VIEVDGSIHEIFEYEEHDIGRSEMLNDFGITVIRFTNEQILNDLDGTIKQIKSEVRKLLIETRQHLNE
jgi:very-short-patch-repair endonuclease